MNFTPSLFPVIDSTPVSVAHGAILERATVESHTQWVHSHLPSNEQNNNNQINNNLRAIPNVPNKLIEIINNILQCSWLLLSDHKRRFSIWSRMREKANASRDSSVYINVMMNAQI